MSEQKPKKSGPQKGVNPVLGLLASGTEGKTFKPSTKKKQQLQGINTTVDHYTITTPGVSGEPLWELNFSSLGADQNRYLTISGGRYLLLNYASSQIPTTLYIVCAQLTGMIDQGGQQHGIIAALKMEGAPVPVYNQGGVIGYNVLYTVENSSIAWDITGIPVLTFDISIVSAGTPLTYPLQDPLSLSVQVTHVAF